jgi:hypothetical protein
MDAAARANSNRLAPIGLESTSRQTLNCASSSNAHGSWQAIGCRKAIWRV